MCYCFEEVTFMKKEQKSFINIKKCRPISRILSLINQSLIIYLDPVLLQDSSYLPFNNGREALKC